MAGLPVVLHTKLQLDLTDEVVMVMNDRYPAA